MWHRFFLARIGMRFLLQAIPMPSIVLHPITHTCMSFLGNPQAQTDVALPPQHHIESQRNRPHHSGIINSRCSALEVPTSTSPLVHQPPQLGCELWWSSH